MRIILNDINKSYDRLVLDNLSYVFESGKLYVIKGVSGCGKSTLLNVISGLETEYDGKIHIEDGNMRKAHIFQYSLLISKLTVLENLMFIKNDVKEIKRLAEEFGVLDLLEKYPEMLSGGERQRVAIIRAMLLKPNVLFADEPTASLDDRNSRLIAKKLFELKSENVMVLVATHEHYFDEYADEIIDLHYGKIGCEVQNECI